MRGTVRGKLLLRDDRNWQTPGEKLKLLFAGYNGTRNTGSDVRVQEGPEAKQLGAVAYTRGNRLHFQPGQYQPESPKGQELLGQQGHCVQREKRDRPAEVDLDGGFLGHGSPDARKGGVNGGADRSPAPTRQAPTGSARK